MRVQVRGRGEREGGCGDCVRVGVRVGVGWGLAHGAGARRWEECARVRDVVCKGSGEVAGGWERWGGCKKQKNILKNT